VVGSVSMGCTSIHIRGNQAKEYIPVRLSTSNKGWHSQWFYLKNVIATAAPRHVLPEFSLDVIESALDSWAK
jgi:hypothetical protein